MNDRNDVFFDVTDEELDAAFMAAEADYERMLDEAGRKKAAGGAAGEKTIEKYLLKNLCSEHRYEDAAAYYDDSEYWESFTSWDCYYCMKALKELGRDGDIIRMYDYFRDMLEAAEDNSKKMTFESYAWAIYRQTLKNYDFTTGSAEEFKQIIDDILNKASEDNALLRWKIVRLMVKAIEGKVFGDNPDYADVNKYLDMVNPIRIEENRTVMHTDDGRSREQMSDREIWFNEKSKAQLAVSDFEGCVKTCDMALASVERFHNHMDLWFIFRKAKAYYSLGDVNAAEENAKYVISKGLDNWGIKALIMRIAMQNGQKDEALKQAGTVMLAERDRSMLVNVYAEMAQFLYDNGEKTLAYMHRRLYVLVRTEKGWPVAESPLDGEISDDIANMTADEIVRTLIPTWKEWRNIGKVFITGTVNRILPSGVDGFIRADDGKDYHFNFRNAAIRPEKIKEGVRVKFTLADMLDRRRNEIKPNAVEIELN